MVIAVIAFIVFWFSRPADLSFDAVRSEIPDSAYSQFAEIGYFATGKMRLLFSP